MIGRVTALTTIAVVCAASASAQESDFGRSAVGSVIAQDESGHRNIPNFRFDRTHTAGGHFQITDTNWRMYAPGLGIDLVQYPNAMSAPEQLQGQVAGKMYAVSGVMPWAPYNARLRGHLHGSFGTPSRAFAKHEEPPRRHEVWAPFPPPDDDDDQDAANTQSGVTNVAKSQD